MVVVVGGGVIEESLPRNLLISQKRLQQIKKKHKCSLWQIKNKEEIGGV